MSHNSQGFSCFVKVISTRFSEWKAVFLTFPVELSLALSVWYHLLHMTTWLLFWFF